MTPESEIARLVTIGLAGALDPGEIVLLDAAELWLDERATATACLAPLLALKARAGTAVLAFDPGLEGLAVLHPSGICALDGTREQIVSVLLGALARRHRVKKIVCAGVLKTWVRKPLGLRWDFDREHELIAMVCEEPRGVCAGRWAVSSDLGVLQRYQELYNAERRTAVHRDFDELVRNRQVAVLEHASEVASVLQRNGDSSRFAALGGTFTFPLHRRRGYAECLTRFVCSEVAAEGRSGHLIVDDDNAAAIALYAKIGFRPVGTCYMGYVSDGRGCSGTGQR